MSKAIRQTPDMLFKIIIIGDTGVGKTNILVRFCDNEFRPSYVATIGVDFKIKTIKVGATRLKFQIWDTAGQERFKTIAQTYYKGAAGIILTYSITDLNSFLNIQNWMTQIRQYSSNSIKKILIGNKCEIHDQRKVTKEQGLALAQKYGMKFMEVSAKTGLNIYQSFQFLGQQIMTAQIENNLTLRKQGQKLKTDHEKKSNQSNNCRC